eukprot:RCo046355
MQWSSLPTSSATSSPSTAVYVGPFLGWVTLMSVGAVNVYRVFQRYTTSMEAFLQQQGLSRPHFVVQQLRRSGVGSYLEMHWQHLAEKNIWLLEIPAPNRRKVLAHLQDTSAYLWRALALPAGLLLHRMRRCLLEAFNVLCEPLVMAVTDMSAVEWSKQELLEMLTIATTLAVLWQMSAGVIRGRSFRVDVPLITFDEVIGMHAAKAQVEMYVKFLQSPEKFTSLGARMPKGCLFAGPPGTGKTYLAKAVAGTAGVPFFAASGSDFMEIYVGQGARSIRGLFKAARKAAPSVIFIDELDAVGCKRSTMEVTGEHTRTINQLLAEMDGMVTTNVIIFAATNRVDFLDTALLRPGRFDKVIHMDVPDQSSLEQLFSFYLSDLALVSSDGTGWKGHHGTLADAEAATRAE